MIPVEAVAAAEAAVIDAMAKYGPDGHIDGFEMITRAALEAALPYLSEAARQPQRNSPTDWPDIPKAQP